MPINLSTLDNQFRFRPALNGGGLRTKIYPEVANANFRYGEPVIINSSGGVDYVQHITTLGGTNLPSASLAAGTLILGFALANASNSATAGNPVPILLAQGCEVLTRIYNGTSTNSELQDVNVGDKAEIFRFQKGATTTDVFMVISDAPNGTDGINKVVVTEKYSLNNTVNPAFLGEQATTDTYGLVWVSVRPTLSVQGQ